MGLTKNSTGYCTINNNMLNLKINPNDKVIALGGNPNVGKSTIFNSLTGMNQHTGNWPGKTVGCASGKCNFKNQNYVFVDLPGTYSLMAHSAEEEIARNFLCFYNPNAVIIVCDATCLERNLNLVLQTLEITENVILCLNLMDEAKRKNISIDIPLLEKKLGIPVVPTSAGKNEGIDSLLETLYNFQLYKKKPYKIVYNSKIENAINFLIPFIKNSLNSNINSRWLAIRLLENNKDFCNSLKSYIKDNEYENLINKLNYVMKNLELQGISKSDFKDIIVSSIVKTAENICNDVVTFKEKNYYQRDRKLDKILMGKFTGIPIMILLLAIILYITIIGANYPSEILSALLFKIQDKLTEFCTIINMPPFLHGILVLGIYRVLAWVVAVMLPPMAIFFPLFTLLEDLGYLPRIAFNLDKSFKKCGSCGKNALTMCMGFGCNAAGVVGCRIIDSPRERLIAIITNSFVPCNGKFPTLIAIITMFFAYSFSQPQKSILSTLILTSIILFGIFMTFSISKILSKTILKGIPSSFTLELPPFRRPQIGKILISSIFDRTIFVLGRAISVAAPAGAIIWLMANTSFYGNTLLYHASQFLNPIGELMGMDGVILIAFILGFPANEIVIPIIIMTYMSTGTIMEMENITQLRNLLLANGWTWLTALCVMIFSLIHWPCSTTCLTIKRETCSLKWTILSFLIPTLCGVTLCIIISSITKLLGLV